MVDDVAVPLEVRLEKLARLHGSGALDEAEFRAAKAAVLADPGPPHGAAPGPSGPVSKGALVYLAVMLAFGLACLSAAFTVLQRPAGFMVCGSDELVAGQTVERAGSETSFNIDSSCRRPDGTVEHVSQLKVGGALWLLYTPPSLAVVFGLRALVRQRRAGRGGITAPEGRRPPGDQAMGMS